MTKLVNLFKRNKGRKGFEKSAYQSIAELLFQNGVKKLDGSILSVSQVNRYLGIVRKERNKIVPSAVAGVQSGKKINRQVVEQTTPDYSWVYSKKSKVMPARIEKGSAELIRLQSEEKGEIEGWNVWNGKDEFMWRYMLQKIDEWNKDKEPCQQWEYKSNAQSFKSAFTDENFIELYEKLMRKLKKPIREI